MDIIPKSDPYIQHLDAAWYQPYVEEVAVLRLDIIHPTVSGNKWYKLKMNVTHALDNNYKGILTFGGAYSNHLVATAATAKVFGLVSIGIVRGIYAAENLTPTLKACREYGMQLIFITNKEYSKKTDGKWLEELQNVHHDFFIVPEGGANKSGREGAKEIADYIPNSFSHICVSIGTGTSFIGIRNNLNSNQQLNGYVPMKGGSYIRKEILPYLESESNKDFEIFDDWHFSGFGKWNTDLISFMNSFYAINNIPLDIVYTSKMMYGVCEQIKSGYFPNNAKILCIHTGGLQGNTSVQHLLSY